MRNPFEPGVEPIMASFEPIDFDPHEPPPRPTTPPVRRGFLKVLFFLTLAALIVYGGPLIAERIGYRYELGRSKAAEEALKRLDEEGVIQRSSALFRLASTRVQPAVVNVSTGKLGQVQQPGPDGPRQVMGEMPLSSGSGVIIDKAKGFVVTNNHVLREADTIKIRIGRRQIPARLVGADRQTDLAVIQVPGGLEAEAAWGSSDDLDIGDWVLAIGSPFDLDRTVTAGIVSATGRADLPAFSADFYQDFVQTDAAINPGNSGGPLINLKGEVVGINTAIMSETGGSQGIGLAISSELAKRVAEQLIKNGRVVRGYLGIAMRNLRPEETDALKIPESTGVFVNEVVPGSPADRAGLKSGDVVVRLNGHPIEGMSGLRNQTIDLPIREGVPLSLLREGAPKDLEIVIEEMPIPMELGLRVIELPAELARAYPDHPERAVGIEGVMPGSLAARAGLRPGMRIKAVGAVPVNTLEELNRVAAGKFDAQAGLTVDVQAVDGQTVAVNIGGPSPGPRRQEGP